MATKTRQRAGDVFETDIAKDTAAPEDRAFFEKEYAKSVAIAGLLQQLEAARNRQRLSKREIARRMDRQESAVSRLFKGEGANPTLSTIADLAYALNLEIEVRIKERPIRSRKPLTPVKILAAAQI
jgi:ribosome-binding protein aMBF1 (putative translation factor)